MKTKKTCMLLVVGLCLCFVATAQAEVQYLGEACLTLTSTTRDPETLRLDTLLRHRHVSVAWENPYSC